MQGTCVFYDPLKGWGFIWCEATDQEYFVHRSAVAGEGRRKLKQGDSVQFEIGEHQGRTVAVSVQRTNGGAA
jgi:cold shock protein